jgi:hypothetical protein
MEQPKKVVRNIPIFIESRNEILINNSDETDHNFSQSFKKEAPPTSSTHHPTTHTNDLDNNRAQSSSRDDIPQKAESSESIKEQSDQAQGSSRDEQNPSIQQEQKHLESSIEKIQTIQVL